MNHLFLFDLSRRLSSSQDLSLVGQIVARQRFLPAMHRPCRPPTVTWYAARIWIQRMHPALFGHAWDRHWALLERLDRDLLQLSSERHLSHTRATIDQSFEEENLLGFQSHRIVQLGRARRCRRFEPSGSHHLFSLSSCLYIV